MRASESIAKTGSGLDAANHLLKIFPGSVEMDLMAGHLFCPTLQISRRRGGDIGWKAGDIPALAVSTGSAFDFL